MSVENLKLVLTSFEDTIKFNELVVNADQVLWEVLTIRQQPFNMARMVRQENPDSIHRWRLKWDKLTDIWGKFYGWN